MEYTFEASAAADTSPLTGEEAAFAENFAIAMYMALDVNGKRAPIQYNLEQVPSAARAMMYLLRRDGWRKGDVMDEITEAAIHWAATRKKIAADPKGSNWSDLADAETRLAKAVDRVAATRKG